MTRNTQLSDYIRSHVLGVVAIFIALTGTAVGFGGDPTASTSVVTDKKFKKLKQRVAALEGKLNAPAGGDLGGVYPNLVINPNAVTTAKIADNAVTTGKVADNAVTTPKIAANAVTTVKIADNAVSTTKIANDAVTNAKIGPDAVTDAKLAAASVGASELKSLDFRSQPVVSVANNDTSGASAQGCNVGEQIITWGGFWGDLNDPGLRVQSSLFFGAGFTTGGNQSGAAEDWTNWAMCLVS
jgi:hypothetical protein